MTVNELSAQAEFKALTMPDGEREITGVYIGDLLSWVMGRAKADCAWITIMSNINIVAVASLADTACIILAESVELPEDVVSTATQKNVNILSSELGAYEIACKLNELI
ncbi:MAG TPA: hypothetical protein IAD01_00955 [Candidatus Faeciplasma gallinarum]|uniref:DRTGG domain-containing protein n=1 Tax=Candidatus Faeciplasma gallinarum TaxID=2840799 RepID=A0A9D1EMP1_9FIRM|nr:hypothetical protein [Candidatus Faeciplasma gallinarum]